MMLICDTVYGEVLKDASVQLSKSLYLESHCHLIIYLISKDVLSTSECEDLKKQKTGKPGLLIDILQRKPETMFEHFLVGLQQDYKWIVEDLNHRIDLKKKEIAKSEKKSNADSGNVSISKGQGGISGQQDSKKKNTRKRGGQNKQRQNQTTNRQYGHKPQGQRQMNNREGILPSEARGYRVSSERYTEEWVNEQSHLISDDTERYANLSPSRSHHGVGPTPYRSYPAANPSLYAQQGPEYETAFVQDELVLYDPGLAERQELEYHRQRFQNPQAYSDPRNVYMPVNQGSHTQNRNFQPGKYSGHAPHTGSGHDPPLQDRNWAPGTYCDEYHGVELHSQGAPTVTPPVVRRRLAIRAQSEDVEAEAKSKRILKVMPEEEKHSIETLYNLKIILIGELGVGKSSLLKCYYKEGNGSRLAEKSTLGVDIQHQVYMMNKTSFSVTFFDVPGSIDKGNIFTTHFKGCHGAILIYDINESNSIEKLHEWLTVVEKNRTDDWLLPITIVGNKTDLKVHEDTQKLNQQELDKLQEKYATVFSITFTSTSAKEFENVIPAFEGLIIRIVEDSKIRNNMESDQSNITLQAHRQRNKANEVTSQGDFCCSGVKTEGIQPDPGP